MNIKKALKLSALAAALLLGYGANAQTHYRNCASFDHLQHQLAADPSMVEKRQQIEDFAVQYAAAHPNSVQMKGTTVIYTIPVVVHVLYHTTAQNISDAQINSQITVLNQDYQLLNSDASLVPSVFSSLKADCQIQFCLAQQDPSGAATTGIIRKSTTKTSFDTDLDDAKSNSTGGDAAWPAASYLNLWVVPDITAGGSPGILGYAQFPGGPAATDGVVIGYQYFGNTGTVASPYNKGRTASHEVGHWLNLYHIWGDDGTACSGSDLVGDTPNQGSENYGCPTFPHVSCSNGPNGDLFMNYMDYTDDACMYMFSTGQKTRMHSVLATGGSRASLATSLGCTAPGGTGCTAPTGLAAGSITTTGATLSWTAVSGATSYSIQYKTSAASTWTTVTSTTNSKALTGLTASTTYNWKVATVCGSTTTAYTTGTNFTTSATASCASPSGLTNGTVTGSSAVVSWTAVSGATSYKVHYKTSASSTWTIVSGITGTSYTISGLSGATTYNWGVGTVCGSSTSAYTNGTNFTTTSCTNSYESNNTTGTATSLTLNTAVTSMIGTSTDKDYYVVTTTSAAPKLKVTLTTLPADYDIRLLNTAGSTLRISENAGTTSETMIYNASAAGTYYIYVYGYSGAYSSTACYTLTTQTSSTSFTREAGMIESGNESKNTITFYPNPTHGMVQFDYYSDQDIQAKIDVVDQSGRLCRSINLNITEGNSQPTIDLSGLPAGMYFVRFATNDRILTSKLLLQ